MTHRSRSSAAGTVGVARPASHPREGDPAHAHQAGTPAHQADGGAARAAVGVLHADHVSLSSDPAGCSPPASGSPETPDAGDPAAAPLVAGGQGRAACGTTDLIVAATFLTAVLTAALAGVIAQGVL